MRALLVYITESKCDETDKRLQQLQIENMNYIKYISFKDTSSNKKIASLHINNMNNIPVRFESLIEINVKDEAYYNGKSDNVRNLLLKIKYNNAPLFIGVEQGIGFK